MKKTLCLILLGFSYLANLNATEVIIETNYGSIQIELFPEDAPKATENFIRKVWKGT